MKKTKENSNAITLIGLVLTQIFFPEINTIIL